MSIYEIYKNVALKNKDKICLVYNDMHITYEALDAKVDEFSYNIYARIKNFHFPQSVGICLDRNIEMIVSVLASLKLNLTYIPLDPSYPKDRNNYFLKNSNANIVLTTRLHKNNFNSFSGTLIIIDDFLNKKDFLVVEEKKQKRIDNPLMCIIHTSGSTGKPKGVLLGQNGILQHHYWIKKAYPANDNDVFCLKSSLNVVDSFLEIYDSLLMGVRLSIIPMEHEKDPEKLSFFIAKEKVTKIMFTPTFLKHMIVEYPHLISKLISLRTVFISGEHFPVSLMKQARDFISTALIINLYGATEVTATASRLEYSEKLISKSIDLSKCAIGVPINGIQIYILDELLKIKTPGEIGELYIEGYGLAWGYINQPRLTAVKFIPNLYGKPGTRLYRTGDLGTYTEQGQIELCGRADNLIKIRGNRLEPGEIEGVLQSVVGVLNAAVVLKEQGTTLLVAYIKVKKDENLNLIIKKCQEICNDKLPLYMQPNVILALDKFPTTTNGKLDKAALVSLPIQTNEAGGDEPLGKIEKALAKIWKKILRLDHVNRTDNFFILGGNSLLITLLIGKINKEFDVNLQMPDVINNLTISKIAKHVQRVIRKEKKIIYQINDKTQKKEIVLYLIHSGSGNILPYYNLKTLINVPTYAVSDPYFGQQCSFFASVENMADYYANSILEHYLKSYKECPIILGGWSFGGIVAFEIADILLNQGLPLKNLILFDTIPKYFNDFLKNTVVDQKDDNEFSRTMKAIFYHNAQLGENYKLTKFYKNKLTLIKAIERPIEIIQLENINNTTAYGWEKYAQEVVVYETLGEHNTIFDPPHVESLSKIINSLI